VKKIKVKDIAKKYGTSPRKVLMELKSEGIVLEASSSPIPFDMLELVEAHFAEVFGKSRRRSSKQSEKAPSVEVKEIHVKTPIIVKQLAEALDKKPNEIISELMKLGELASINQSLSEEIATFIIF
jgi:translation initiation factor IF-2